MFTAYLLGSHICEVCSNMARRVNALTLVFLVALAATTPVRGFLEGLHEDIIENVFTSSEALQPWIVNLRRDLHQIPEPGFQESETSSYLQVVLKSLNVTFMPGLAHGTGILAEISAPGSSEDSPTVAVVLRADMDALPITEPGDLPYKSTFDGWMHACGHDSHMAMLLGAAAILKRYELAGLFEPPAIAAAADLPRPRVVVRLAFQPAEEGGAGGDVMVEQGAMEDAVAAFGIHLMPHLPSRVVGVRAGTIMAGAISFRMTVSGRGGHAALPHTSRDPIVAASHIITALQTLVSRETSPLGSAVLSVTFLHGGDAYNVIPDSIAMGGTIRALTQMQLNHLQQRLVILARQVAAAFDCAAEVDWREEEQPYYPPTVNHPAMAELVAKIADTAPGLSAEFPTEPLMAGEDFAFFCEAGPCALAFLGIHDKQQGVGIAPLHSPLYVMDERVLHQGAALHVAVALSVLQARVPGGLNLAALQQLPHQAAASCGAAEESCPLVEAA